MEITAKALAEYLGGEVVGDPLAKVTAPARIEQSRPGTICFYANPKYERYVYDTKASILLVNKSFEPKQPVPATLIKVEDAYQSVARLLGYFSQMKKQRRRGNRLCARMGFSTHISASARIGKGTYLYPQVYLGPNVRVGRNCILYPGVKIYHDCVIGDNCILHSNVVIGADGFGFAPREDGTYDKIPQLGNVIIEDDVEIGACSTVDRSTMNSTVVRKGVKIDNLCQIAHNVEIGESTVISAQSGVAGSARIGSHCMIGGQSGIQGHITIADGTKIAGQSGVMGNVNESGKVLMGSPAFDYRQYIRAYALFKNAATKR
ncbi:MAG: UDP-3-O-(3-hydroxymyristoyl)glucosamine N-acyltransferase [Bacteroidales bacterium]|nr:UDP-3-O-(3-hydroxymyristoyl)glucosamine N-acyltransferase [Candidatus Cacconaster merdequi]